MKDPSNPDDRRQTDNHKLPAEPSDRPELLDDQDAGLIAGETLEQVGAATVEARVDSQPTKTHPSTGRSAFFVGAGILISRIVGLIRQRIFAHYFGSSGVGDAFSAA